MTLPEQCERKIEPCGEEPLLAPRGTTKLIRRLAYFTCIPEDRPEIVVSGVTRTTGGNCPLRRSPDP
jgi:hypothetical protein